MSNKYTLLKYPFILEGGKKKKKRNSNNFSVYSVPDLTKVINKEEFIMKEFPLKCPGYTYTPSIFPAVKRIVALGDIHGDCRLALKMLKLGNLIDISNTDLNNTDCQNININWTGGDTYVVQVGDQVDRCRPLGNMLCDNPVTTYNDESSDVAILKLFNKLDAEAQKVGGKVISLLGNHELMNSLGQLQYVSYKGIQQFDTYIDPNNRNMTFSNPEEARKYAFSPGNEYGTLLGCSRLSCVIIGNNLFVHAGIVDGLIEELQIHKNTDFETINIAVRKWLLGLLNKDYVDRIVSGSKYSMFWNRILGSIPPNINLEDPICMEQIGKVLKIVKVGSLIIGHTPQSFIYSDGINKTCNNSVWRIDNGSSSAFHKYDYDFLTTGKIKKSREPQVLEILNDTNFNIIK